MDGNEAGGCGLWLGPDGKRLCEYYCRQDMDSFKAYVLFAAGTTTHAADSMSRSEERILPVTGSLRKISGGGVCQKSLPLPPALVTGETG